jgi:hypothetical protein
MFVSLHSLVGLGSKKILERTLSVHLGPLAVHDIKEPNCWVWWFTSVIPATQEIVVRRSQAQVYTGKSKRT